MDRAYRKNKGEKEMIYAQQLKKEGVGMIKADDRKYTCISCGEYVTFVPGVKKDSYFRHKPSDIKNCQNKTSSLNMHKTPKDKDEPLYMESINSQNTNSQNTKIFLCIKKVGREYCLHILLHKFNKNDLIAKNNIEIFNKNKMIASHNLDGDGLFLEDILIKVEYASNKYIVKNFNKILGGSSRL